MKANSPTIYRWDRQITIISCSKTFAGLCTKPGKFKQKGDKSSEFKL